MRLWGESYETEGGSYFSWNSKMNKRFSNRVEEKYALAE